VIAAKWITIIELGMDRISLQLNRLEQNETIRSDAVAQVVTRNTSEISVRVA
jgi:hypothetical protein